MKRVPRSFPVGSPRRLELIHVVKSFFRCSLLFAICCLTSCDGSGKRPTPQINKVPVVPVRGTVTVDGKPEVGVKVQCIPQGEFAAKEKVNFLRGITAGDGKFSVSTYEAGDGLPPGEYIIVFMWPTPPTIIGKEALRMN